VGRGDDVTGSAETGGDRQFHAVVRDMSERRAADEQAARHTRVLLSTIEAQRAVTAAAHDARFRLTFENSPLGLALSSVDERTFGRYLQTNPALTAITGYSAEELLRMSFHDLQHPDDVALTENALRQMITSGPDSVRAERRYLHKDGHTVAVSIRVAVVRGGDGAPSYAVVQVEDVTAQRAADARLHRQAALLELIPAAVIVRRLDGTILWWNSGARSLYGWTSEAAHGRRVHRLLGTVFENGSAARQQAALTEDGHWDGQVQHLTAAGRMVTVLSRQVVHRDGDGDVEVLEINTDVTAARAAEQALALNEQRFRAQFTHSAVGQLIRALDGSLIAVNQAFARMLGRRVEDMVGRVIDTELLDRDELAYAHNEIAGLFAGDAASYTHETRLRHADGHWVDVEATVSLVRNAQDHPRHLIVVVTDISQRRIAERARDQAAAALAERNTALEAANQLKLDIIGMLGHEISNPLSAILGYSDLLADDLEAGSPTATAVTVISRQAQRLDEIVREVLSMVSIDAGNLSAVRGEVSLHAGIAQALESTGATGVPVTGPDVTLRFNPGHLQQVLVNLLANAARYAGGATAVRIEPAPGGRVLLHVEDHGPGVPQELRPRLFDRLTRAERDAGTVRGTGLGLGLYIVRSLARANHGEVRHEPYPAGGSIFTLEAEAVATP
jgi:PAS domain S-box-containing protein